MISTEEITTIESREAELQRMTKKDLYTLNKSFYPNGLSTYESVISKEWWVHSILYNEIFIDKTDEFDSCFKNKRYNEYLNREKK